MMSAATYKLQKLLISLAVLLLLLLNVPALAYPKLVLPASLKEIGAEAFCGDESLEWVVIPEGTVSIGSRAFADCPALWRVEIPASVSYIAEDAFEGSSLISLNTVSGSYGNEFAVSNAFVTTSANGENSGQLSRTCSYRFKDGVLTISGSGAIPAHTAKTPVPWYYFRDRIQRIVIDEGITTIRRFSFFDCRNLESVTIPKSVTVIDANTLNGAPSDTVIYGVHGSAADRFAQRHGYTLHKTVNITAEPADSMRLFDEEMLTLKVEATGDGLTFQWQCSTDGEKWLNYRDASYSGGTSGTWGSTTPSFSCNTLTYSEEGWSIRCMVTDQYGNSAVTGGTTLSFRKPVEIVDQSPDMRCGIGETVQFWVDAEGDGLSYQWYYRNGLLGELKHCLNGNGPTLDVLFDGDYEKHYLCIVTDEYGNETRSFMHNIYQEITLTDPADAAVEKGEYAVFAIEASGSDLTYQWQYRSAEDYSWSTSTVYGNQTNCILIKADSYHDGLQYRCRVTDADGIVQYTAPATLSVSTPATGVTLSRSAFTLDMTAVQPLTEWSRIDFSSGPVVLTPIYDTNLVAAVQPKNADNTDVIWSSSNPEIVSIVYDESGMAVSLQAGVTEGTATVTVTTADGKHTASCEVTVRSTLAFDYLYIDPRDRVCGEPLSCDFFFSGGVKPYSSKVNLYRISDEAEENELVYTTSFAALRYSASYRPDKPGKYYYTAVLTDAAGISVSAESDIISVIRPVNSITLNRDALTLDKGETATLTAAVSPADASDQRVEWSVDNTSIVSCSDGMLVAMNVGTTTVTARSAANPAILDTCTVTVRKPLEGISLNESEISLDVGQTFRLKPSFHPADATDQVISRWTTSASSVASVANGLVTARAAGTAVITASTPEGFTARCTVRVGVPATGISLDQTVFPAYAETSGYRLTASVYPANTTEKIIWSSSDPSVVTSVSNGVFSTGRIGTAIITASTESGAYSASCTVTVKNKPVSFLYSNVLELMSGESALFNVYLENGYQPYDYQLVIRNNHDMSESAAYYWEDVYYHERKVSVNFDDPGYYTVILTMTDANGAKDVSAHDIYVQDHVSIGEILMPSNRYYTGHSYRFSVLPENGLGPYSVFMSLHRTSDPDSRIYNVSADDNVSGLYEADFEMPGRGSYFVRIKATDMLGETVITDSEVFTVEDIPVHTVTLNARDVELRQGETFRVKSEVYPLDATDKMLNVSFLDNVSILDFYAGSHPGEVEFFARESGECYVIFSSRSNPEEYATLHVTVHPQEDLGRITIINTYVPSEEEQEELDRITIEYEEREQERAEQGQDTEYTEITVVPGQHKPHNGPNEIIIDSRDYFPSVHDELAYSLAGYQFVCYPLGNSDIIPYTGKDLSTRGDVNGPRASASIYADDMLYIKGIGLTNGINWARVSYPTSSGRKEAYIDLWDIIGGVENETREMTRSFTLTKKRGGGGTGASVRAGQFVYLLYRDSQACQVMVFQDDGTYFIGWCTLSEYEGGEHTTPSARDYFPDVNGDLGCVHAGFRYVCYPLGNSNIIPYTDKTLETRGNTGVPRSSAVIYANDELILLDLGRTNGINWAKVSYPSSSGPKEAYIDLWDIIGGVEKESRTASATFALSHKRGGTKSDKRAIVGEAMHLLYRDAEYCQIIARQDDGSYFIGWCTLNEYDGVVPEISLSRARLDKSTYKRNETIAISNIQIRNANFVKIEGEYLTTTTADATYSRSYVTLPTIYVQISPSGYKGTFPINITAYDSAGSASGTVNSLRYTLDAPEKPLSLVTGFAPYTGIDYTAELRRLLENGTIGRTEFENRLALLNKAQELCTVKWISPLTFHTWRSGEQVYNSNLSMVHSGSPQDYIHFWEGIEYKGIPYCAHGSHNNDNIAAWEARINSATALSDLEGTTYYNKIKRPNCTYYGIDCSRFVLECYKAAYGKSFDIQGNTLVWKNSPKLTTVSDPRPGDLLLMDGHVMLYVGKTSSGKTAVMESTAACSGCRYYDEFTAVDLKDYTPKRYINIGSDKF